MCRKLPILTYRTCVWLPRWAWRRLNFAKIFGISPWAIVWLCLRDRVQPFWHNTGVWWTDDMDTHDNSIYRASIALLGKKYDTNKLTRVRDQWWSQEFVSKNPKIPCFWTFWLCRHIFHRKYNHRTTAIGGSDIRHLRTFPSDLITSAEEGGYVFGSVCLSVRRITHKLVNGFWRNFLEG